MFNVIPVVSRTRGHVVSKRMASGRCGPVRFMAVSLLSTGSSSLVTKAVAGRGKGFALSYRRGGSCVIHTSRVRCAAAFVTANRSAGGVTFVLRPSVVDVRRMVMGDGFVERRCSQVVMGVGKGPVIGKEAVGRTLKVLPNIVGVGSRLELGKKAMSGVCVGNERLRSHARLSDLRTASVRGIRVLPRTSLRRGTAAGKKVVCVLLGGGTSNKNGNSPSLLKRVEGEGDR